MLHQPLRGRHVSSSSGKPDRLAPDPDALFVYGTLQFSEVLHALLGRIPNSIPAAATGWRAAALDRRVYPGLVPSNETASGLLLNDLTKAEWQILDDFEDDRYELRQLPLLTGRHGWAYVWPDTEVRLENWRADEFRAHHLAAYVARFMARATRPDSPVR